MITLKKNGKVVLSNMSEEWFLKMAELWDRVDVHYFRYENVVILHEADPLRYFETAL